METVKVEHLWSRPLVAPMSASDRESYKVGTIAVEPMGEWTVTFTCWCCGFKISVVGVDGTAAVNRIMLDDALARAKGQIPECR